MQVMGPTLQFGAVKRLRHPAFSLHLQRGYQDMAFMVTGPEDRKKYTSLACETAETSPQWIYGTDYWEPGQATQEIGSGNADVVILRCYRPNSRFMDSSDSLMIRGQGGLSTPREDELVPASAAQIKSILTLMNEPGIEPEDRELIQDIVKNKPLSRRVQPTSEVAPTAASRLLDILI